MLQKNYNLYFNLLIVGLEKAILKRKPTHLSGFIFGGPYGSRDRYFNFINDFPKMESVAKNYHIASYLGITQQSLSRIRTQK